MFIGAPLAGRVFFLFLGFFLDFSVFFPIISILGVAFVLGGAYIDLEIINLTNEKGYFTMTTYPYNVSGDMHLRMIIEKLRSNFLNEISKETMQKLGIAPNRENLIVKTLQFIKLFDADGKPILESETLFTEQDDKKFQLGFAKIVKTAYAELFKLHKEEDVWNLNDSELTTFFRGADRNSVATATKQVKTFNVLKEFAGKKEAKSKATAQVKSSAPTKTNKPKQATPKSNAPKTAPITIPTEQAHLKPSGNFALSVRIEVNLPAGGTKETYDNIFKSIRENLINE